MGWANRDAGGRVALSLALQTDKTLAEYTQLAQLADRHAFDVVSVYNDLLFQPALGPLLIMAPHLRRAQLGPAALNPYTLHPIEIAGQLAMLDTVTDGRAYLGLARGAWLDALGMDARRPLQTLREAVLLVRHLLARRPEAFEGQVFRLAAGAALRYAPRRSAPPIVLGTWGRRTAALAGEVADEVKVGGSANPALVPHLRPAIDEGSRRAGRLGGSVGVCLGAVTVVDEQRARARARARREIALYLPVVAPLDPTLDDPDWLARLAHLAAHGEHAAIADLVTDAILERFAFAGDPDDIIRQVEEVVAAGATRVEFGTPHGADDPTTGIELLGTRVLPHFLGA